MSAKKASAPAGPMQATLRTLWAGRELQNPLGFKGVEAHVPPPRPAETWSGSP